MAVSSNNLKQLVLNNAQKSDEIIIISGFFSVDILDILAQTGIPLTFYYGMYLRNGISAANYTYFQKLESKYSNLTINIPFAYHVHTKCYIFKKNGNIRNILIGSANCSGSALDTTPYSEILMDVTDTADILALDSYANEIRKTSVHFDNPSIVPGVSSKIMSPKNKHKISPPESWNKFSGNPFSANIPLYYMDNGIPKVHPADGLNWGLGSNHHSKTSPYAEACIPIRSFIIDNYPTLIPFQGTIGSGTGGKITRRQSAIDVLWDDGTSMQMHFEGNGPKRPTPSNRKPGNPFREYPKQLTSSGAGIVLGEYLRKRLNVSGRVPITYTDLVNYGRDYVTFTLTNAGNYELDFHV